MAEPTGAAMFRTPADAYDRFVGRYGRELARALIDAAGVGPDLAGARRRLRARRAHGRARAAGRAPGASRRSSRRSRSRPPAATGCRARASRSPRPRRSRSPTAPSTPRSPSSSSTSWTTRSPAWGRCAASRARAGPSRPRVWDYGGEMTLLRQFWDAAARARPVGRARRRAPHGRTARRTASAALWTAAGLDGVKVGPATVGADYDGFDDLWAPFERGVGPAGRLRGRARPRCARRAARRAAPPARRRRRALPPHRARVDRHRRR